MSAAPAFIPDRLLAPFPYFGGKSPVAALVWDRLGDVSRYIEPFAGSLAMLLLRPEPAGAEVVNDLDCFVANFRRALRRDPDAVTRAADFPLMEVHMRAAHARIVDWKRGGGAEAVAGDVDYCDAAIAGLWCYGMCAAIAGYWGKQTAHGRPVAASVNMLHGRGIFRPGVDVGGWLRLLASRLRGVTVMCGDWTKTLRPATLAGPAVGVFLDPPYGCPDRDPTLYAEDSRRVAGDVRAWCAAHGERLRIALCGYAGEGHEALEALGWDVVAWRTQGGFMNRRKEGSRDNRNRERIWFSPRCLTPTGLF